MKMLWRKDYLCWHADGMVIGGLEKLKKDVHLEMIPEVLIIFIPQKEFGTSDYLLDQKCTACSIL